MQYIVTINHTTSNTSINQRTSTVCTHWVDATDETDATSKINAYYSAMNSGSMEHTAEITHISTLIS